MVSRKRAGLSTLPDAVSGSANGALMVVASGSVINGPQQDLAVAETTATVNGRANAGLVSLSLGAGGAPSPLHGVNIESNSTVFNFFGGAGAKAGTALAIGDIDGDGLGDLVIGAGGALGGAGKMYVVFGPSTMGPTSRLVFPQNEQVVTLRPRKLPSSRPVVPEGPISLPSFLPLAITPSV